MVGFQVVLRGYDRHQVEYLIDRIEGTLGRGPLNGPPVELEEIDRAAFDVVLRGYHRREVDQALAEYRRELAARSGAGEARGETGDDLATVIRKRRFGTVAIGGYDPQEVDAFLDQIASRLGGR